MKAPWISKKIISNSANEIIASYHLKPPFVVEKIIEKHFGLRLVYEVDQINFDLDDEDLLGAIEINTKTVYINHKLAESEEPGRYCFTCAHELGHWIFHRKISRAHNRSSSKPLILCRTKNQDPSIEWQADYFATSLLLPEVIVRNAYKSVFGDLPLEIYHKTSEIRPLIYIEPCVQYWPLIAAKVLEAGNLTNVSKASMIRRLQEFNLVINHTTVPLIWSKYSSIYD